MRIVGIDPGKNGALALLSESGEMSFFPLKDFYDDNGAARLSLNPQLIYNWLYSLQVEFSDIALVCCEKPIFMGSGFTIQTSMSMFESYGVLKTCFHALCIAFHGVRPIEWIKYYPNLYHPKQRRDKVESVVEAKNLFPLYADELERVIERGKTKGTKKPLDGYAEAALIAKYGLDVIYKEENYGG